MEPVGLALGIVGLAGIFSTCLDVIEKWDSYKEYEEELKSLTARFTADRLLFQRWGDSVGLRALTPADEHHKALDDPSTKSAIKEILLNIAKADSDIEDLAPSLGQSTRSARLPTPSQSTLRTGRSALVKLQSARSRVTTKAKWALFDKARCIERLQSFNADLQRLLALVPPDQSSITGQKVAGADPHDTAALNAFIQEILSDVKQQLYNETRKELNSWLDMHDTARMYDEFVRKRVDDTCGWILNRSEFSQWQSSTSKNAKVLWVHGPPGYGKTILCARMVQHMSTDPSKPVAYFFFSSDLECREDPFVIMRSWLSQVTKQSREAFDLVQQRYQTTDGSTASQTEIEQLLKSITQNIPGCTFVVDGLDECTVRENDSNISRRESLLGFFESLRNSVSDSKSHLLILSRNDHDIREGLKGSIPTGNADWELTELQISPEDVRSDATLFSQNIVGKKLANKTEAQRQELANQMVDRCESMFLGIKLLEPDLRGGKNLKQLQQAIEKAPAKLDKIYDRNWGRIMNLEDFDRDRVFAILRWTTFALRPMTVFEITDILLFADDECDTPDYTDLPDSVDEAYIKTEILELCESLIEVRGIESVSDCGLSTIHLSHFSVRQYVLSHLPLQPGELIANERLRSSNEALHNNILAKMCMRYVNCEMVWENVSQGEGSSAIQAFRKYATHSWSLHVRRGVMDSEELVEPVNTFFCPGNQNWNWWKEDFGSTHGDELLGVIYSDNTLFYATFFRFPKTIDYLLGDIGLDVNTVDVYNRTALHCAAAMGWTSGVKQLLEKGADVNIAASDGRTPLFMAASVGDVDMVNLFLEHNANPTAVDKDGLTAMLVACGSGHIKVVELLLNKCGDVDLAPTDGWTPIYMASGHGHIEVVKLLLKHWADANLAIQNKWAPILIASQMGHVEIVKLLLENRVDANVATTGGWTPILIACYHGHVDKVRLLLDFQVDMDAGDNEGFTPMYYAASRGHTAIVRLLLEKQADVHGASGVGWTPLHSASHDGYTEIVKLLLEKGADPMARARAGVTPLSLATDNNHVDVVGLFLEKGVDLTVADTSGWVPFASAARLGHEKVIELFLTQSDTNPELCGPRGRTPLSWASGEGHEDVVDLLVADIRVNKHSRDHDGLTPLMWAVHNAQDKAIKSLVRHGYDIDDDERDFLLFNLSSFMEQKDLEEVAAATNLDIDEFTFGLQELFQETEQGNRQ